MKVFFGVLLFSLQIVSCGGVRLIDPGSSADTDNTTVANGVSFRLNGGATNDEYGQVDDHADFAISTSLSVFTWYKGDCEANDGIVGQFDLNNQRSWILTCDGGGTKTLRVLVSNNGTFLDSYTTDTALGTSTWYHIGFTFSSGFVTLYINGVDDTSVSGLPSVFGLHDSTLDLFIGAGSSSEVAQNFNEATLDELGIWNSALSDEAVAEIYSNGPTMNLLEDQGDYSASSSLVSWYRMGDDPGDSVTTLIDVVSGHNATLTNADSGDFSSDTP